ncbi:D-tyrosyl-tRNA(Tyr) deacylase, variant 2 [Drechslerella dactyloides]|uniref:D-aminoacyl-tRNA deacylase n=1 Tax=Drechslerella dactyloides TaxID=74499 RepID=A0AAD6NGY3_DREDA|nr:D-tyrosyl-tRNA(Tyr) deacylase, variant 2 [Drechslerella dactyloides]
MKAIVQRVLSASVTVESELISSISKGILVFAAVGPDDDESDAVNMAGKVLKMRFWDDEEGGKWKKNVVDIGGEILCAADALDSVAVHSSGEYKEGKQGMRLSDLRISGIRRRAIINEITAQPDFHGAMEPEKARALYETFFKRVQQDYQPEKVKDGVFQAMMQVALVNDGPVTLELNTPEKKPRLQKIVDKKAKIKGTETPGSSSQASEAM